MHQKKVLTLQRRNLYCFWVRDPNSNKWEFVLDNKNINLNFKVATSTAAALDFSPVGLFSQIRVEAGAGSSIVLEAIDDPAVWANFIYQYTWTQEDISIQSCKQRSSNNVST